MAKYKITAPDGRQYIITGGDVPPTEEQISQLIKDQDSVRETPIEQNDLLGAITKFDDGYSYGFGRKLGGLINAIGSAPVDLVASAMGAQNVPTRQDRYNEIVDVADKAASDFSERHPVASLGLELGGAIKNPANIKFAEYTLKPANVSSKIAKLGGTGLATGGLEALGKAESLGDLPRDVFYKSSSGAAANLAFPVLGKAIAGGRNLFGKGVGWLTGTGDAINQAFDAGTRNSTRFMQNFNNQSLSDVIEDTKNALGNLKIAKNKQYQNQMQELGENLIPYDASNLRKGFDNMVDSFNYKGFNKADKATTKALNEVDSVLSEFEANPLAHDVMGLDALKQRVQNITFPAEERAGNYVVGKFANNIKNEINDKYPKYAKIMQDYSSASDEINELSKSLLGNSKKLNPTTALGKMQRAYRNNAQSVYGKGQSLLSKVDTDNNVLDALAGQALNSWAPRGLLGGSLGGGIGLYGVASNPQSLALLPFTSPKIMGYGAYGLGKVSKQLGDKLPDKINPASVLFSVEND